MVAVALAVVYASPQFSEDCTHSPSVHYALHTDVGLNEAKIFVDYVGGMLDDVQVNNITDGAIDDLEDIRDKIQTRSQELRKLRENDYSLVERSKRQLTNFIGGIVNFFTGGTKAVVQTAPKVAATVSRSASAVGSAVGKSTSIYPNLVRSVSLTSLRAAATPIRFAGETVARPLASHNFLKQILTPISAFAKANPGTLVTGGIGLGTGIALTTWQVLANKAELREIGKKYEPLATLAKATNLTVGELNRELKKLAEAVDADDKIDQIGFGILNLITRGNSILRNLDLLFNLITDARMG